MYRSRFDDLMVADRHMPAVNYFEKITGNFLIQLSGEPASVSVIK